MPFDRRKMQLARFQVNLTYNICFTYWSLKGVLAERWGHGPVFGAFTDLGNQVNLTPALGARGGGGGAGGFSMQGMYGIQASGFNAENLDGEDDVYDTATTWLQDVVDVLKPRRSVRAHVQLLGLYPIRNPEQASRALADRFSNLRELERLVPDNWRGQLHTSAPLIVLRGDEQLTIVVGTIGPPHQGLFFTSADVQRDKKWWMGVCIEAVKLNDEGITEPLDTIRNLISTARSAYDHAVRTAVPSLID